MPFTAPGTTDAGRVPGAPAKAAPFAPTAPVLTSLGGTTYVIRPRAFGVKHCVITAEPSHVVLLDGPPPMGRFDLNVPDGQTATLTLG